MKEGLKQCFVEEGAPMARLLNAAIRAQGLASMRFATIAFVSELLTALRHPAGERCVADAAPILSPREMDILRSLGSRQSNKTIARQLRIAENTVKFHLRNIYEKLGVNSRAMAVAVARRLALILDAP
jgi:LuxR family maltose regulon positive regulatory protein